MADEWEVWFQKAAELRDKPDQLKKTWETLESEIDRFNQRIQELVPQLDEARKQLTQVEEQKVFHSLYHLSSRYILTKTHVRPLYVDLDTVPQHLTVVLAPTQM